MDINQGRFLSIEQLQDQYLSNEKTSSKDTKTSDGLSFKDILSLKSYEGEGVKFSKHASSRLSTRNIQLSAEQMQRLNEGAAKASMKGIKESLVLVDSLAFIVNVPSNTVITAMDNSETSDNIYTNIDGAVII
ncbi:MAG: flagellar protein [Lachnospiraceae bacterium]|nr:flagellar protein [Lachnospiraceae bacterium]